MTTSIKLSIRDYDYAVEDIEQTLIDSNDLDTTEHDRATAVVKYIEENIDDFIAIELIGCKPLEG